MSAQMDERDIIQDDQAQDPLQTVETESDKRVAELMARVRKLDHNNTNLQKELERKNSGSKSLEERLAIIEREREEANNRARTVEAFADAGLNENWRRVFEESDPYKRADTVRTLLKSHEQEVAKKMAIDLGTAGSPAVGKSGKPSLSMDDLAGMSEAEINKAFREGRVQGMK